MLIYIVLFVCGDGVGKTWFLVEIIVFVFFVKLSSISLYSYLYNINCNIEINIIKNANFIMKNIVLSNNFYDNGNSFLDGYYLEIYIIILHLIMLIRIGWRIHLIIYIEIYIIYRSWFNNIGKLINLKKSNILIKDNNINNQIRYK